MYILQHRCCDNSTKNVLPESNYKGTSDKPKLRSVLKNTWPIDFTSVKVRRIKGRRRNTVPDRRTHQNATHDLEFNPIAINNIVGTRGELEQFLRIRWWQCISANFLIFMDVLLLCRRMFVEMTLSSMCE